MPLDSPISISKEKTSLHHPTNPFPIFIPTLYAHQSKPLNSPKHNPASALQEPVVANACPCQPTQLSYPLIITHKPLDMCAGPLIIVRGIFRPTTRTENVIPRISWKPARATWPCRLIFTIMFAALGRRGYAVHAHNSYELRVSRECNNAG